MSLNIDKQDKEYIWNCITNEKVIVIDNQWISEMFNS